MGPCVSLAAPGVLGASSLPASALTQFFPRALCSRHSKHGKLHPSVFSESCLHLQPQWNTACSPKTPVPCSLLWAPRRCPCHRGSSVLPAARGRASCLCAPSTRLGFSSLLAGHLLTSAPRLLGLWLGLPAPSPPMPATPVDTCETALTTQSKPQGPFPPPSCPPWATHTPQHHLCMPIPPSESL